NPDSMQVYPNVADSLANAIEKEGVPVTVQRVGSNTNSPIGDAVVSNLEENGSLLLISDGRVTSGRSLIEAADIARSVNTALYAVNLSASKSEKVISIEGPSKTSLGVEAEFSLHGTNVGQSASRVTISVDGQQVESRNFQRQNSITITRTFQTTGEHTISVSVSGGDTFSNNNVAYKTVSVVEKPKILYVRGKNYPFSQILNQLYTVETSTSVPSNLNEYYAVVMQDV
ncbi:MAG: magnesium chelatase, partial [Halobacteria archaeon]|nr:magnesium chelatase [Halobacteria archaeon]